MLVELSIIPLETNAPISRTIARVIEIIRASGLPYQLCPTCTVIEGDWEEVMDVVRRCHERARQDSPRVSTLLKIHDQEGAVNRIEHNVNAVMEQVRLRPG